MKRNNLKKPVIPAIKTKKSISTNESAAHTSSFTATFFQKPKANGNYLSKEFYKELNKKHNRNVFTLPANLLQHSKQIKPKVGAGKSAYRSKCI